jgi:membrane protease YdiL (CAAX protease family)
MNVQDIFLNKYGRVRSGWRFLLFCFFFFLTYALMASLSVAVIFALLGKDGVGQGWILAIGDLVALVIALVLGWVLGRFLEGLPFRALGALPTGRWVAHLGVGLFVGGTSFVIAVAVAYLGGGLRFEGSGFEASRVVTSLAASAVIFLIAAAFEEALFRGYIFQTFTRAGMAWFAILITSGFFGAVHTMNPNANAISTLNTALAGLWLGVAYLKTRDLWFPLGIHMAWNWMQGAVFGVEVSGMREIIPAPLLKEIDIGPAWLTGGDYGLEAGVACTLALALSTVVIYFLPSLGPNDDLLSLTSRESAESRA